MSDKQSTALIIGASFSGLASAACLQKENIEFLIIEKGNQVATPWRNHYDRLHLHTNKRISNLPHKKFGSNIGRYPSRQEVIIYLEDYQRAFNIRPVFATEATSIKKIGEHWITETNNGIFRSKYVITATGPFGKPKPIRFKGMESFPGKIMHSYQYKTAKDFQGQKVLVVGFGNSACEIAIDLFEQGASPFMAVRSPVNIIPRDILGLPALEISLLMSKLPPRIADKINGPLIRLLCGDLSKLGLKKMTRGPLEEIQKEGRPPVLDIGTLKHIRKGHIRIMGDLSRIEGKIVEFEDGGKEEFDTIVAGIGYERDSAKIIAVDERRFEDLKVCIDKQQFFGKDGLYFCGFWIAPTGQIREIALDAKKIAADILRKERSSF